ncbi:MAG: glycosyltransferase family 2 protein [Candidatus Hydrogenedentes bacterium]|nr:glycosyltransferase family 2 protein [Candidatus Hydrogenedentota bacterium]
MCRVSVIVPTHNRAASLPAHVDRVLHQTAADYEAVYVNDSSTDDTARILDEYAARFPGRLRVVHVHAGAPGPARNAGAAIARGGLLLFTDDDVTVPDDWVARMLALYEAAGRPAVCGGVAPVSMETDVERYLHCRVAGAMGRAAGAIHAAPMMNFMVTREAFQAIGGFLDTPLRAAEDWEFCRRLRAAGFVIHYDPGVEVLHAYQRELIPAAHRMRDAGAAGVYIWLKHHRGAFLYTAYSLIRCVLSPFWIPFRYPIELYALAVHMEYVFAEARLLAYVRYLRGKPVV